MADDTPQNLPAIQKPRAVVADAIPVFDTGRFEHYGRIATVLAQSSLVPDTLKGGDNREVAIANCFQVVELADRWGYSPFAVAQCASVVHGKLMLEGKLVAAVLQSKLGIRLHHYFTGEWGHEDYRIFVTDRELAESEALELKPHVKIHGVRMIDGSVKEWRTKEKGGGVKGNWLQQPDVQLIYRGDRTWARVYESATMLGVYTEDEFDDLQDRRLPVEQPSLTAGMDAVAKPRAPRKPKDAAAATTPPAEGEEGHHAASDGQDEASGDHSAQDAEFEDAKPTEDTPRPTSPAEPTATETAPPADDETTSLDSATDASTASVEETSSQAATSSPSGGGGTQAPNGEVYCLRSDEPSEDGRVPTYKDGVPFSKVKAGSKAQPATYDRHAPEVDEVEDATANDGAAQEDPPAQEEGRTPDALVIAMQAIDGASSYLQGKQVLRTITGTPEWKAADEPAKAQVRQHLWARYVDLRDAGKEHVAPYEDFQLMRAFLEFGAERAADIDGMWPRFWKHDAYKKAGEVDQRAISELMFARKEQLA